MPRRAFRLLSRRPRRAAKSKKSTQLARPKIAPKAHQPIPGVTDLDAYYLGKQSLWFLQQDGIVPNVCFESDSSWPPPQGAVLAKGMKNVLLKGRCGDGFDMPPQQIAGVKDVLPMYGKYSVLITLINGKRYRAYSMRYSPNQGLHNSKYNGS